MADDLKPWEKYASPAADKKPWEKYGAPTAVAEPAKPASAPTFGQRVQTFTKEHPYVTAAASFVPGLGALSPSAPEVGLGAAKQIGKMVYDTMTGPLAPVLGPIGLLTRVAGKLPGVQQRVERATEYRMPGEKVGGAAAFAAEALLPIPGAGTKAVQAGREFIESRAVAATDPVPTLIRAIKPKSTSIRFNEAIQSVLPEIKAAEADLGHAIGADTSSPGKAVYDTIKAVQTAKTKLWSQIQQHLNVGEEMGVKVDLTPLAEAEKKSIPAFLRTRNPRAAVQREITAETAYRGRSMSIPQAEELLQSLNAKLDSYYQKYPTAQRMAAKTNPETSADFAAAEKLRDLIYDKLNDVTGSPSLRGLKQKYGKMIEVEKNLWPRLNVAMRQSPSSLSEQIGKWESASEYARGGAKIAGALISGHPSLAWSGLEDLASGYAKKQASSWLKDANTTDTLLRRAFANFKGVPEAVPPPIPFRPKALLEAGARRMPGVADTSGPIPWQPRPGAGLGQTGARELPPPSQFQQPGFAVSEDLVPVVHPVTGKIEYVPKWLLQPGRLGKPLP